MNVQKFVGASSRDALKQVREALGPDALILSNRAVENGVEIVAMAPQEMAKIVPTGARNAPQADRKRAGAADGQEHARSGAESQRVDAFRPPRVDAENVVRGSRRDETKRAEPGARTASARPQDRDAGRIRAQDTERAYGANTHEAPDAEAGAAVMAELKAVRGLLETQLATLAWGDSMRRSPLRMKFTRQLLTAGMSPLLVRSVLAKMPDDYSEEQAGKWLADIIARNIPAVSPESNLVSQGGVYAIVGPTGVGKTTTTAKLAARCVVRFGADRLALLTTDSYRIGAQDQLRTYGRILGVPVHVVQDESGLAGAIASLSGKHLVLIDTVGMGQRDSRVIEQVSMLANSGANRILVLNATAHPETLEDVVQAFQGKALAGCIVSKADESVGLGGVLDTVLRHRLPLHFVANGQRVPEDLFEPEARHLVQRLLKSTPPAPAFQLSDEEFSLVMAPGEVPVAADPGAAHA